MSRYGPPREKNWLGRLLGALERLVSGAPTSTFGGGPPPTLPRDDIPPDPRDRDKPR
ncbi:MAG: hypothetical protein IT303_06280 [Dehalococcoidia bacterium]|nr:hypothetical protein [Dehalococcoidia bacterium]